MHCNARCLLASTVMAMFALRCAVPVAPSGGPPDRDPPEISRMEPPDNTVNFSGSTVSLDFNEYVEENSFLQALQITPEPPRAPQIKWSGRSVDIRFRDALEENTTYIITVGTRLRDIHGVSLEAPITRAFSTGPEINRSRISGRILNPIEGSGTAGLSVFAYAAGDTVAGRTLPDRPLYRTETDASGAFEFSYLSDRPYFVVGVGDRNSNRRIDNMELVAAPPVPRISADTSGTPLDTPWYAAVFDTVRPEARRIQLISPALISLRYSEDVFFDPGTAKDWTVSDTARSTTAAARALYRPHGDSRTIIAVVPPLSAGEHLLSPGPVADSAGNRASQMPLGLSYDGSPDTTRARFAAFLPHREGDIIILGPSERAGFKLSVPADSAGVAARVSVTDTAGAPVNFSLRSPNRVDYFVEMPDSRDGEPFIVRYRVRDAADPDSLVQQHFRALTERDLGSISGILSGYPDTSRVIVEARERGDRAVRASTAAAADGRFDLTRLPSGVYTLRLYRDDNRNSRWDPGIITPYQRAEPIFWTPDSLRVRARWETEMDTLRITGFLPETP